MTDRQIHEDDHIRECAGVLARLQEFIDHEVDGATDEAIREHIAACEPCLDQAEIWSAMRALVKRACAPKAAPEALVTRISFRVSTMRIERRA